MHNFDKQVNNTLSNLFNIKGQAYQNDYFYPNDLGKVLSDVKYVFKSNQYCFISCNEMGND